MSLQLQVDSYFLQDEKLAGKKNTCKRRATPSPDPTKRSRRRKPSDGLFAVASAMASLQESFSNDTSTQTTPQCQTAAIRLLEESGELSQDEFIDAVGLFQEKATVATAYLAIKNPASHVSFLQKQLEKARHHN
jgi:hypothetical protein